MAVALPRWGWSPRTSRQQSFPQQWALPRQELDIFLINFSVLVLEVFRSIYGEHQLMIYCDDNKMIVPRFVNRARDLNFTEELEHEKRL